MPPMFGGGVGDGLGCGEGLGGNALPDDKGIIVRVEDPRGNSNRREVRGGARALVVILRVEESVHWSGPGLVEVSQRAHPRGRIGGGSPRLVGAPLRHHLAPETQEELQLIHPVKPMSQRVRARRQVEGRGAQERSADVLWDALRAPGRAGSCGTPVPAGGLTSSSRSRRSAIFPESPEGPKWRGKFRKPFYRPPPQR